MNILETQAADFSVDLTVQPTVTDDEDDTQPMKIDSTNNLIDSFNDTDIYSSSLD